MPKGMKPSPNFRGNKNSGDKPDSVKFKKKFEEKAMIIALQAEAQRIQVTLANKDLTKEEYKVLIEAFDKINKNIQLLKGKPTENVKFTEENYDRAEEYFIKKASGKNILQE